MNPELKKAAASLAWVSNAIQYRDSHTDHDDLSQSLLFIAQSMHSILSAWVPSNEELLSESIRHAGHLSEALRQIDENLHKELMEERWTRTA